MSVFRLSSMSKKSGEQRTLECPHCDALIDPRMDGEHLQCPWCDGRFISGDEKPIGIS
jgi:uncharacterized paraquat-inducible protein A